MPPKLHAVTTTDNPLPADAPSAHISHADIQRSECHNRMHGFETGIVTLTGEMEGQESAYQSALERRRKDFDAANATALADHTAAKADLLRRIDDLTLGKRMVAAALDVYEEDERNRK